MNNLDRENVSFLEATDEKALLLNAAKMSLAVTPVLQAYEISPEHAPIIGTKRELIIMELNNQIRYGRSPIEDLEVEQMVNLILPKVLENYDKVTALPYPFRGLARFLNSFESISPAIKNIEESLILIKAGTRDTSWIPEKVSKELVSDIAKVPGLASMGYALRAGVPIAWATLGFQANDLTALGSFAAYVGVTFTVAMQEIKLKNDGTQIFNPYVDLASLIMSPRIASVTVRFIENLVFVAPMIGSFLLTALATQGISDESSAVFTGYMTVATLLASLNLTIDSTKEGSYLRSSLEALSLNLSQYTTQFSLPEVKFNELRLRLHSFFNSEINES